MKLRVLTMIAAVLFPVHLAIAGERGAVNNDNRTVSAIALNDEQMDRVVAGFISIDLATELSRLPATDTHPGFVPSGLTFQFLGFDGIAFVKKG
jgi:hypothetical protein